MCIHIINCRDQTHTKENEKCTTKFSTEYYMSIVKFTVSTFCILSSKIYYIIGTNQNYVILRNSCANVNWSILFWQRKTRTI